MNGYIPLRNLEIEKLLQQDIDNREIWAVYSDWLQEKNDPRGKVIALELSLHDNGETNKDVGLIKEQIDQLYDEYSLAWLGETLTELQQDGVIHFYYGGDYSDQDDNSMRFGFISDLTINDENWDGFEPYFSANQLANGGLALLRSFEMSIEEELESPVDFNALFLLMPQLKHLTLTYLNLPSLPNSIYQLTKLFSISLQQINLNQLSGKICQLKKLVALNICGNNIANIPVCIGLLEELRFLHLDDNPIASSFDIKELKLSSDCEITGIN